MLGSPKKSAVFALAFFGASYLLAAPGPVVRSYPAASLPAASGMSGQTVIVSDGNSASDCSTGGGTFSVTCKSNGTAWSALTTTDTPIRSVSTTTTLTTSDYTVLCNAATSGFVITLPASPLTGKVLNVKKIDSTANACTISPNGASIDGASGTVVLNQRNQSLQFQFDGTNWWIL